jgi:hypothetical protein
MGRLNSKVDDSKVQGIVVSTISYVQTQTGIKTVNVTVLQQSWLLFKDLRRTPNYCESYDLAAAEHYFFAAFLAAKTGDPITQLAPRIYAIKKKWKFFWNDERSMRTDPRFPVLPPDDGIDAWGINGAQDGLKIFKNENPGLRLQPGAAIESLTKDAGYSDSAASAGGDSAKKLGGIVAPYL